MGGLDLDLVVSLVVVLAALGFLLSRFGVFKRRQPKACCASADGGGVVVLNARLAKALKAAEKRRSRP